MDVLGPDAKLTTTMTAHYTPNSHTTQLDVYGSADPTLNDQDIVTLYNQLTEQNISLDPAHTQINSDQLKPYRFGPGWMLEDLTNCEISYRDWLNLEKITARTKARTTLPAMKCSHSWGSTSNQIHTSSNY